MRHNFWTSLNILTIAALFLGACGIEVGNPSEPTPVPTKAEADRETILQLASTQVEEGVQAALESFEATSMALTLRRGGLGRSAKCQPSNTGLSLSFSDEFEDKNQRGPASKRLAVQEKTKNELKAEVQSPSPLTCPSGQQAKARVFDWNNLSQVTISAESKRSRSRTIALASQESKILRSSQLTSAVKKQVAIERTTSSSTGYTLFKTLALTTESQLTQSQNSLDESFSLKSSTPEGRELKIVEQLSLNGQKTSFTIVSGSLLTERSNDLKIRMDYENLVFSDKDSCYPTTGIINGSRYTGELSEVVSETFQLVFTEDGASLRFADGSESDLILETCQLNPY